MFRWQIEDLDDCANSCSRGFIRRKITCIKQSITGIQALSDTECQETKPSTIGLCQGRCSPTIWRYSDWSNVSSSLGTYEYIISNKYKSS